MKRRPTAEERRLIAEGLSQLTGGVGRSAARTSTHLVRYDIEEFDFPVELSRDEALRLVQQVLASLGEDIKTEPLMTVLRTGTWGMNPGIVTVSVSECKGFRSSTIHVRSIAAEGLIKQRGGAQAAQTIKTALARLKQN